MKKARLLLFISLVVLAILPLNGSAAAQTGTMVYVDPELTEVEPGDSFTVEVWVKDVVDLYGFDVVLNYDPAYLDYHSISMGDFLDVGNSLTCGSTSAGTVQCNNAQINPSTPKNGDGILFSVTFEAKSEERYTYLTINENSILTDWPDVDDLPYTSQAGDVKNW